MEKVIFHYRCFMCEKVTMTNCFVPNLLCTIKVHKGLGLVMKPAVTGRVWVVSALSISSVNMLQTHMHIHTYK